MQVTVENCSTIDIHILQTSIAKMIKKDFPDSTIDETYQITLQELKKFTANGQTFEYTSMKNFLGGYRWFIICPKCKTRCHKLLLPPPGCLNKESKYFCKNCHRLKNQSSLMSANTLYKKVTRPLKRMKEIEDKVAKGHLRMELVQSLLNEYEQLENLLKNTNEYRVYSFKKKHNLL